MLNEAKSAFVGEEQNNKIPDNMPAGGRDDKEVPFYKGKWFWVIIALFVSLFAFAWIAGLINDAELAIEQANKIQSQNTKTSDKKVEESNNMPYSNIPGIIDCPSNLSGILTSSFIETKYITFIEPLGAVNPSGGHITPVDHNYFQWETAEKIRLFAPADAWITDAVAGYSKNETGQYDLGGYTLTFTICKGATLVLTTYVDIKQSLKDELEKFEPNCIYDIKKVGHDGVAEGQCIYNDLNIKVESGEELGWTQRQKRTDGNYVYPFEIWAYNYNQELRKDIDWDYYYQGYPYAVCLFDWYNESTKNEYYSKLGWNGKFRTVQPICGEIDQNIIGTLQGSWFTGEDKYNAEAFGKAVAFFHDHIDPTKGKISIGGFLSSGQADVVLFTPRTSGMIDREPSGVTADGQIYCYNFLGERGLQGKILTQLIDDKHIKLEYQVGICSSSETFMNPILYER